MSIMAGAPLAYSADNCSQGMLIATNSDGRPIQQGVVISDLSKGPANIEPSSAGSMKLTEVCFSPPKVTRKEMLVETKEPVSCNLGCIVDGTCTCVASGCKGGLLILKNVEGRPINYLETFPIQFVNSDDDIISFSPKDDGVVQVTALCFGAGKVKTVMLIPTKKID